MKRTILMVIILSLFVTTNTVQANSLSDLAKQKNNVTNQINQGTEQINQIQQQSQNLEESVEVLDDEIGEQTAELNKLKTQAQTLQDNIKKKQEEIDKEEQGLSEQQGIYGDRLKTMYLHDNSYIEMLFSSQGISDLINKIIAIKQIVKYDQNLIGDMKESVFHIKEQKEVLEKDSIELATLQNKQSQVISILNSKRQEQEKMISILNAQEQKYQTQVNAAKNELQKIVQQVRAEQQKEEAERKRKEEEAQRNGSTYVDTPSTPTADAVVGYAYGFLGIPYQWGGNGPSTYDCSGFTKAVYAHFGITICRVACDQQNQGTYVGKDQLRKGDLVFFGNPAHHVGIYVGNNCFIHAPHTGDFIKVSSLSGRDDFYGGRRLF